MKVLFLSHISELLGGAERSMLDVVELWAKEYGLEPEFILRKPVKSFGGELQRRGWKYYVMDYTFWSDGRPPIDSESKFRQISQNTNAVLEIEKIIQKTKPDVVMTNSIVCPWAAIAAYYQNVPHVWFVREYGDLDHGRTFEIGRQNTFEDIDKMSDMVVTISKALADHLGNYIDKDKISILYNPFDINNILERASEETKSPYRSKESLKLAITGNLSPSKGQLEVIEAVGLLKREGLDVELSVIGGDGPEEYHKAINTVIKKYKLRKNIHLIGYHKNPLPYIKMADVGIMTSRMEGFGRVTFEYIALGKPVVGANSGATPEMVIDGSNGYLYKHGNQESLMDALRKYANDRKLISLHGRVSSEHAHTMMASQYNAKELYKKVENLLSEPRKVEAPLHIAHKWLELPALAQQYIDDTRAISLKVILKQRSRRKLKWIYKNARTSLTKRTGK